MGIYYHAPQPTQAAAHVPIPNQGNQPPRSSIVRMQVAVGSWPIGYEPAQYRRNFSRVSIAPLTLVYGNQPPIPSGVNARQINNTWPRSYEVASYLGNFSRVKIAPLTLVYGNQPPRLSRDERKSIDAWFALDGRVRTPVRSAAWDVTVFVGNVPPSLWQQQIWMAWNREQAPVQRLNNFAPLTFVYGDQPPPLSLTALRQVLRQYGAPDWRAQSSASTAAWNIPSSITGDDPPPKVMPWYTFADWFEITWSSQHANAVTSLLTPSSEITTSEWLIRSRRRGRR